MEQQLIHGRTVNCSATTTTTLLMVIADDFGMNALRTDAILAAGSCISRTSLLVNGEDAVRAAQLGKAAGLHMGLHFNLTEGYPLSSPIDEGAPHCRRALPLLTQPDHSPRAGEFLGKLDAFLTLEACSDRSNPMLWRSAVDDVKRELDAQLTTFVRLTGNPDVWLDGHNHVHVLDVVWSAIVELCFNEEEPAHRRRQKQADGEGGAATSCRCWRVVGIRMPCDDSLSAPPTTRFSDASDVFGMPFWQRVSALSRQRRDAVPPHVCCPDVFIGFDIGGASASVDAFEWKLQAALAAHAGGGRPFPTWRPQPLPHTGHGEAPYALVELMTHLGFAEGERSTNEDSGRGGDTAATRPPPPLFLDDACVWRLAEWQLYTSEAFAQSLARHHAAVLRC